MAAEIEFSTQFRATRRSSFLLTLGFGAAVFLGAHLKKDGLWAIEINGEISNNLLSWCLAAASLLSLALFFLRLHEERLKIKSYEYPESQKILIEFRSKANTLKEIEEIAPRLGEVVASYPSQALSLLEAVARTTEKLKEPSIDDYILRDSSAAMRKNIERAAENGARTFDTLRASIDKLREEFRLFQPKLLAATELRGELTKLARTAERKMRLANRIITTRLLLEGWLSFAFLASI